MLKRMSVLLVAVIVGLLGLFMPVLAMAQSFDAITVDLSDVTALAVIIVTALAGLIVVRKVIKLVNRS